MVISEIEEELFLRERNRAAEIATGIIVMRVAPRVSFRIVNPVVGIQDVVSGIEPERPMVFLAAGLADGVNHGGPFGNVGAEIGGLKLHLLGHTGFNGCEAQQLQPGSMILAPSLSSAVPPR